MQPSSILESSLHQLKKLIPKKIFKLSQPIYHYSLAWLGAILYRFPSRQLKVIAVTGTKGKTSTVEILATILTEAGFKVASTSTLQFKIGQQLRPNLYKMSMPGRMFLQRFLRQAVKAGCQYAILEVASEGAKLFRHKFIDWDGLIFTNISPEHIESHGSYENYLKAKLQYAKALNHSNKEPKFLVANHDDPETKHFKILTPKAKIIEFSLIDAEPYQINETGLIFTWRRQTIKSDLAGQFNLYNILGAATMAEALSIEPEKIKVAIEKISKIKGRMEKILTNHPHQNFDVIVDYAHTTDSLTKAYAALGSRRKICVLGGTGGGRDRQKRSAMGEVAKINCEEIILTNEDPYDEDPQQILSDIAQGITPKKYHLILDRREAIHQAITMAQADDVVIITGKGTDPYIMGPDGQKTPWSDYQIAQDELLKRLNQ